MLGSISKIFALTLLLMWSILSEESCCGRRNKGRIPGRLEVYVVMGVGKPPKCVVANPEQSPREGKVNQEINIWFRAVFYDALNKPIPGRQILLDVIDSFGNTIAPKDVVVTPEVVTTNDKGFNETTIRFRSAIPGVFRIRAIYDDKSTKGVSYGPSLLIK